MKMIKTDVNTISNSSLRAGVWLLRELRLSEDSQSQEEELSILFTQSVRERYLRVPAVTRSGSQGEMSSTNHHAPERLPDEEQGCGIKQISILLLPTTTLLIQKCTKMFGEFKFQICAEERVIEFLTCAEECVIEFPTCEMCEISRAVPSSKEGLQRWFQGEKSMRSERGVTLG